MEAHKDIIEQSKQGNQRAQYEIYRLYSKSMLNTCYRLVNNRELAEDMLQEAFTQAFLSLDSFRYESSFGSWLKRIVINNCLNELKRRKIDLVFLNDLQQFYPDHGDDKLCEPLITVEDIKKAMVKLPVGARTIFSLYLLEGYDHSEISQILNISESASRSQYSRAKSKMKKLLSAGKDETISDVAYHHNETSFTAGLAQLATNFLVPQHI